MVERAAPSALCFVHSLNLRTGVSVRHLLLRGFEPRGMVRRPGTCWLASMFALALTLALPAVEISEPAPLAAKSLLLDAARAGSRLVAVGDRGHVLLSDDEGKTWRQVIVPTRAMLTGVSFGDAQHGCAVGHDGVILTTNDAGITWARQNSGEDLDTVFLDVHFPDASRGIAVGAYGKCLVTSDGGVTWRPLAPSDAETHFNQIVAGMDGSLYLSGESGTLLASQDGGGSWSQLPVPYDGSLFGLLPVSARKLLVYGLRGHVYCSDNNGASWTPCDTDVAVLIMAGIKLNSGAIILAGLGGNFHVSRDDALTFALWKPTDYNGGVSALLETADGALLAVGELGAVRLKPPAK
jgi:photosystem II stability/assembly factor-like uncharacterized protein